MFEYTIPILIIKKSNKKFRICINYKILNKFIIKNRNTFFLIKNILIKLCFIKYYNKFDIITIFNEIRIRQNNKKKTFFIKYNLFEYIVMFFELYNVFDIF